MKRALSIFLLTTAMFSQEIIGNGENLQSNPFIGTWRLITIEYRSEDGTIGYPFGEKVIGYISYNQDGYMFGILQNKNRHKFPFNTLQESKVEEEVLLRKEFLSYCGRYEIQGNKIIHKIEISFFTDWIGDTERVFEFDGDKLTLSTNPFLLQGKKTRTVAVWEKVK